MGVNFMDYLITDPFIIPPEHQNHFTEKILRLPNCYLPNDNTRLRRPAPARNECGLPEKSFVFCCFNQTYKITPGMFDIWCRLLIAVPESVLWLRESTPGINETLKREAEIRGVDPHRLVMAPMLKNPEDHLARLQCADLFLDTTPYNAHTTCSDALWMGLPVITCAGNTFPSRVAGSLLSTIGLPELITYDLDDYYQLALRLSTDKNFSASIRSKLIANRASSPLFDNARFTRDLEAIYCALMTSPYANLHHCSAH
jgi:predicted O-linked N-acetylglucosamine transferase (SPINDLY family)